MPKWIPHRCKVCGRERTPDFHVSRRGLCTEHAIANVVAAVRTSQETGQVGGVKSGEVRRGAAPARRPKGVGGAESEIAGSSTAPAPAKPARRRLQPPTA